MEQDSYINIELEIIGALSKAQSHIRGLSRSLNLNHMSIKRAIDSLSEKNIVYFDISGRNKVFFLKNNLESRKIFLEYELYKQEKILKKYPILNPIFDKIIKNPGIELALLFGSYSKLNPKKESDIDIYLETTSTELKKEIESIHSRISVKIGKFNKDFLLIKEIIQNHVIIKGFEKYYEKTKN